MNKQTGFPSTAASAARKPLLTSIFAIILDIGMLIVAILAYIGAQTDQDSSIIRETHITFPSNAHHIQRLEIALVSPTEVERGQIWRMIKGSLRNSVGTTC
jgi:hypothetical protein